MLNLFLLRVRQELLVELYEEKERKKEEEREKEKERRGKIKYEDTNDFLLYFSTYLQLSLSLAKNESSKSNVPTKGLLISQIKY